jgi:hypothetical protein
METFSSIPEALAFTIDKLIPAGRTYFIDVRGPREISHDQPNCFQVVAETMVYRNRNLGLTVHLPFTPSAGISDELLRFLESPLRYFFDRYVWDGIPCFALRLGEDTVAAERVMRLLLTDVYEYTTGTDLECRVHDGGSLDPPEETEQPSQPRDHGAAPTTPTNGTLPRGAAEAQ